MLKTLLGCETGVVYPMTYNEGEIYNLGDELLDCFISMGGVELVADMPFEPEETKIEEVEVKEAPKKAKK